MYHVKVGPDEIYFAVLMAIVERSAFFRSGHSIMNVSTGDSINSQSMTISLPSVDPKLFQKYLDYCSTEKPIIGSVWPFVTEQDDLEDDQRTFVEAYLLAKLLRDMEFCRHAYDVVWARILDSDNRWKPFTASLTTWVWEKTSAGSSLRRILLQCAVENPLWDRKGLVEQIRKQEVPTEFIAEAMSMALNLIEEGERLRRWVEDHVEEGAPHPDDDQ